MQVSCGQLQLVTRTLFENFLKINKLLFLKRNNRTNFGYYHLISFVLLHDWEYGVKYYIGCASFATDLASPSPFSPGHMTNSSTTSPATILHCFRTSLLLFEEFIWQTTTKRIAMLKLHWWYSITSVRCLFCDLFCDVLPFCDQEVASNYYYLKFVKE